MGTTTSIPKANLKGVSLVDSHGIVWHAYSTLGNTSAQSPFSFSNIVFSSYNMVRFMTSACPVD